jgi:hypothetical protein
VRVKGKHTVVQACLASGRNWLGAASLLILTMFACLALSSPASAATLMGEWPLDEGAGQVARDRSPFGVDARLGISDGVDGADPVWVPGVAGSGLRFDGGDALVLRDSTVLEPANVTIEAWVRRQGTPGAYAYVVSKGSLGCNFSSYGLYTGAGRGIAFYVSGGGSYVVSPAASPAQVWDGGWHHVAGTFDGQAVRLYLDGSQVGAGSPDHQPISYGLQSTAAYIGSYSGGCHLGFSGDLDNVRVWSGAVTAGEIASRPAQPEPGSAGPAVGPRGPLAPLGPLSGPPPAAAPTCVVSTTRRALLAGRRNPLVVSVRRGARPLKRVRVLVSGRKLHVIRRADGQGRARFVLRPRRSERQMRIRALGSASGCAAASIPVRR